MGKAMLRAIETSYNNYRFRSRLEARWAVFFDVLSIEYWYEYQGFQLRRGLKYLPDFWLPQVNMWGEVKAKALTPEETEKCQELARLSGYPCLLLVGMPENKAYWAWGYAEYGGDGRSTLIDYCLTNYKGYPTGENRFYGMPGGTEDSMYGDTYIAARAAKMARFEHGEQGAPGDLVIWRDKAIKALAVGMYNLDLIETL